MFSAGELWLIFGFTVSESSADVGLGDLVEPASTAAEMKTEDGGLGRVEGGHAPQVTHADL